ncbi:MAG: tetratricopeptide repeat protein [Bacteroidota bacterium]
MHNKRIFSLLLLTAASYLPSQAQILPPRQHIYNSWQQSLRYFSQGQYAMAQHQVATYLQPWLLQGNLLPIQASYYTALCATVLHQPSGAERLRQYIQTYPYHRAQNAFAYYTLGNHYYTTTDYAQSTAYYALVDLSELPVAMQYDLHYRWAYACLQEKDFAQAQVHFGIISRQATPHTHAAHYFLGYIALQDAAYASALTHLQEAAADPTYAQAVPCLILEVYYRQQRFRDIVAYSHEIQDMPQPCHNPEDIALITAEAYFALYDYTAAISHYEAYLTLQKDTVAGEVMYKLGYALYQTGKYPQALLYLKKAALAGEHVGSLASYYMGLLYIKMGKKTLALMALDKARQAPAYSELHEEAYFQYAKLCYDLGHVTQAADILQSLKQDYPHTKHAAEVDKLLIEAYHRTDHYDLVIAHVEGLKEKSASSQRIYQQVTLHKGNACFNSADYPGALHWLEKSLAQDHDASLTLQAHLWLGETFSAQQRYELAIPHYHKVLGTLPKAQPAHQQAHYGLGYAYFNTDHYAEALPHFQAYIQSASSSSSAWVEDATIRAADCYYATKAYKQALVLYDRASSGHAAHAHYQKGLIYGLMGDIQAARAQLAVVLQHHTQTPYYEKALFEQGLLALKQNTYVSAIEDFTRLLQEKPHSTLRPDALLHRAVAYENREQYEQAIQDYETLLQTYPTHAHTQAALLALSKLQIQEGKCETIAQCLDKYQALQPDTDTQSSITFETARTLFYHQHYDQAIEQLQHFITHHPNSAYQQEATFLIAEAYYRSAQLSQALVHYRAGAEDKANPHYNKILLRIASIAYQQQDFATALHYYEQLKTHATHKKETYHALTGIMKSSHALKNYSKVAAAATSILKQGNIVVNAERQAYLYLGKAAMQQGQYAQALAHWDQVSTAHKDAYAAEAQYLSAQLHYHTGHYEKSLEILFALRAQFAHEPLYVDQGFLLMADNYIALQDTLQARATLRSIIENAKDTAIIAQAREKLTNLSKEVSSAQDNNQVTPDT